MTQEHKDKIGAGVKKYHAKCKQRGLTIDRYRPQIKQLLLDDRDKRDRKRAKKLTK